MVEVRITNKVFYFGLLVLAVAFVGIIGYAYSDFKNGQPKTFGHTADEIHVRIGNQIMTLQKAIEGGYFSNSPVLYNRSTKQVYLNLPSGKWDVFVTYFSKIEDPDSPVHAIECRVRDYFNDGTKKLIYEDLLHTARDSSTDKTQDIAYYDYFAKGIDGGKTISAEIEVPSPYNFALLKNYSIKMIAYKS